MSALKVIKFETQGPLGTGLALQQALPNEGVAEGSPCNMLILISMTPRRR